MSNHRTKSSLGSFLKEQGISHLINESLRNHCTWRIGGPADFLVEPSSWEQVAPLLQYTRENGIPAILIGKGSNLLFDDAGLRGIVIKIGRKLSRLIIAGRTVQAESGISASRLARATGLAGLTGLEHTVGIPGTLGGLIVMNGGSQRKNIGDNVIKVWGISKDGHKIILTNKNCHFSYRKSLLQSSGITITKVELGLEWGNKDAIWKDMLRVLRSRREKFPRRLPNCGSIFISSPELYETVGPPGKVIEEAGLKGLRVGNAEVSRKHANFIVNTSSAKACDVLELIRQVRTIVHDKTGIWMTCEVKFVRADGRMKTLMSGKDRHR